MATTALASPGEDAGGTLSELIAASSSPPENVGATSLDDLRDELRQATVADPAPAEMPRVDPPVRRRRKGGKHKPRGGKVGRPRKDASAAPAPAIDAPSSKPPLKAEIAAELETTQRALEAERARHDAGRVGELARSLEMIAIVGFGLIAEERGPHWALSPEEAERIGATSAVALAPYAAQLNTHLPWLAAVTTLATVAFKRIQIDRENVRRLNLVP